ncbi:FHIPEP family type III secretion protein, partial [Escherichia coli]|uniref:FHIPEP family type III secretion protein n=1 Tax=Escherichia coli TaxID=562 RepID=UPI00292A1E7E
VNIIGGLSVGVGQNGMDFSTALTVYTILTVGDGLVSQIPALFIAISAGFIVTRVNGDSDNMGQNIMSQLLSNSFVIIVTCVLALSIGLLPCFPLLVFLCLAVILGIYFYFKFKKKGVEETVVEGDITVGLEPYNQDDDISLGIINKLDQVITETVPLVLIMNSVQ